jgi:cob(I)alamin adenosyltransferase
MVRLTKIYTRTGDDGTTGLGDGSRVIKTDTRVEAYGTVDEANAAIGLCVVEAERSPNVAQAGEIAALLRVIQNDLFDVGADLCCPCEPGEKPGSRLRVVASQTERLERTIDRFNDRMKPLDSFVLPGGTPLAAALHLARTITRRAERVTVQLAAQSGGEATNPESVRYLNRLSDLLFVLSRVANDEGAQDVKWVPGASRAG